MDHPVLLDHNFEDPYLMRKKTESEITGKGIEYQLVAGSYNPSWAAVLL